MSTRQCSRSSCNRPAAATLTYVYADSTVVVGQLSAAAEPHSYDLCAQHADRFTAPRGWNVVQIQVEYVDPGPSTDDIEALARAVREAGRPQAPATPAAYPQAVAGGVQASPPLASEPRRGHLRVISHEA